MEVIVTGIILSLFCAGIYIAILPGMVGNCYRKIIEKIEYKVEDMKKPYLIQKPLATCLPCMASVWGLIGYGLLNYCGVAGIIVVTLVCVITLNFLLSKLIEE